MSEDIEMKASPTGDFQFNIKLPEAAKISKQLEHHYCFSKDRHSANFYLKIGAAGKLSNTKSLLLIGFIDLFFRFLYRSSDTQWTSTRLSDFIFDF